MEDLWKNERRLWEEGVSAYNELLAPGFLMAFGPMELMSGTELCSWTNC